MMSPRVSAWILFFLAIVFAGPTARGASGRPHVSFAVVVGNNKALDHRRPDLHYADDDAAKYFAILQTIAPDRTFLLTEFDDDTTRLFPAVRPHATPPRDAVHLVVRQRAAANESEALRRICVPCNRLAIGPGVAPDLAIALPRRPAAENFFHVNHCQLPVGHRVLPTATRAVIGRTLAHFRSLSPSWPHDPAKIPPGWTHDPATGKEAQVMPIRQDRRRAEPALVA